MKIPDEVKKIFNDEMYHQLATASTEGIPNISNIGGKYLRDDDNIVVIDNYMKKTITNILSNPNISILIRKERVSYQIKGKCRYLTQGHEYEEAKKWMKSVAEKYPAKGALIITVEDIFNSNSGPGAGENLSSNLE